MTRKERRFVWVFWSSIFAGFNGLIIFAFGFVPWLIFSVFALGMYWSACQTQKQMDRDRY